ncbi:hypothetical protein KCMC57_up63340 [Kitasatospora sp. CMC57]|uniref:RNA polymerase sigma factor n=1 Tax=Kitasatospora sp. CMC57 TaxID=3231513 RepID=A0AB33K594_9ACTN
MRSIPARPATEPAPGPLPTGAGLVEAARDGDARARAALFGDYLPLVYNIVGRGLNGHPDVDDVVQETMVRAMRALPSLREPERFRSWIVAIAVRQMHDHGRRHRAAARLADLPEAAGIPDPAGDFAELAVDRQALARAGQDLLEAGRWLTDDHRETLALWWQECAGQLTRVEVAEVLRLSVPHTAVRIQRMKAKLEAAVGVLAAWRARPRCPELGALADSGAASRVLTRLTRHVTTCARCAAAVAARDSIDELPIRLGSLAIPALLAARIPGLAAQHGTATGPVAAFLRAVSPRRGPAAWRRVLVAGAAGAAAVALALYLEPLPRTPQVPGVPGPAASASAAAPSAAPSVSPGPASTAAAASPDTRAPAAYSGVAAGDHYVAPNGDDANPGTLDRPFATISRALAASAPGQTVAVRGGTYRPTATVSLAGTGTGERRITVSNYRDEQPVLDGSRLPAGTWFVVQRGGFLTVRGLRIVNAPDRAYVCESCHDTVLARLDVHGNGQAGLLLRGADTHDNLVADSDFHDNHETGGTGGYADGLAFKDGAGGGNRVRGCRMYDNSGDGVDLDGFAGAVTVEHTWAFGNGVNRWGTASFSAGGSGFKLGGVQVSHVLTDSAAWDNAGFGVTEAGGTGAHRLARDTAFRNGAAGFAFVSSAATVRDSLALANHPDAWLGERVTHSANSWEQPGWTTASLDVTDAASATAPRGPDGRLPVTSFLRNTRDPSVGAALSP